jgi:hypothetical protein
MNGTCVLGIFLEDRVAEAGLVQKVLTEYGCNIKTRIGLHEVDENQCSVNGLILIQLCGDKSKWVTLEAALKKIGGIQIKKMEF